MEKEDTSFVFYMTDTFVTNKSLNILLHAYDGILCARIQSVINCNWL